MWELIDLCAAANVCWVVCQLQLRTFAEHLCNTNPEAMQGVRQCGASSWPDAAHHLNATLAVKRDKNTCWGVRRFAAVLMHVSLATGVLYRGNQTNSQVSRSETWLNHLLHLTRGSY